MIEVLLRGTYTVVVSTSAWHADAHYFFLYDIKSWVSTLGTCELDNHINFSPVSIWDKEPLRTTSTLAVTTLT